VGQCPAYPLLNPALVAHAKMCKKVTFLALVLLLVGLQLPEIQDLALYSTPLHACRSGYGGLRDLKGDKDK